MAEPDVFDYVIVGSGSAGGVIANRLSASGRHRVLLLEAGGRDRNPWIHVPAGFARLFSDSRTNWADLSAPEPELGGRQIYFPFGKVLGGSSSINGMLYVRGQREDYDYWREMGNTGWGYDDVLPYFRKAEDQQHGESEFHGAGGPIKVHDQFGRHELIDAFVAAAGQRGVPANPDFNGRESEGAGYYQLTTDGWRRYSTAVGYLRPARRRANLEILVDAHAHRVRLEGRRAVGVDLVQAGHPRQVRVRREVIVCAGVFNSPHLLQLSGIGPAERLRSAGIAVTHDLPGVGEALEDHFVVSSTFECTHPVTVNDALRTSSGRLRILADYALRRSGLMTIGASYAGGFFRSRPEANRPDVQCYVSMFSSQDFKAPDPFPGLTVGVLQSRPTSRGSVRTLQPDPNVRPEIRMNYLTTPEDRSTTVAALRLAQEIMSAPALEGHIKGRVRPGPAVAGDDDLLQWARETGTSALHGSGSCRMGQDSLAVVDARLRVRGVEGLRVADGSVMPAIVSGNANAPIIMIGEKASDMILEDAA